MMGKDKFYGRRGQHTALRIYNLFLNADDRSNELDYMIVF